jgi:hypothetical protein
MQILQKHWPAFCENNKEIKPEHQIVQGDFISGGGIAFLGWVRDSEHPNVSRVDRQHAAKCLEHLESALYKSYR